MRFYSTILLVIAIFLFALDISRVATNATPLNLSVQRVTPSYKTTKRFLRPRDGDYESRALDWWLFQNKPSAKVLKKLNLGNNVETLLTNSKLSILQHYISLFNAKNPGKAVTTAETLAKKYGEVKLTKTLELAKSSDTTKALATELQLEQFTVWANQKLSPASVFEKLELNSETVLPFGGPVFEAWVGYVRKLHGMNEDAATSTMVEALRNVYGPRGLALLLFEAKGILDPKLTAGGLRAKQYKLWMWSSVNETNFLTIALKSNSRRLTETEKKILNEYLQFVEANKTKHHIRA
ncbi:hypothetical protein PC112_g23224 [Phytophthora cactorum]|uniref:RxLR effector protein n=2 Tax=Phytophthora cactorum TaxID=29920 RepID=A0A8T1AQP1_9STRA|nr:hypothetical protein PC112_g23224 [Phytophthora cactorum]KAG2884805.1 hypothetical protein PC117_g25725 [Phytophthora cactorum]KAG3001144.1 hypothetical protein PC120_g20449 [Phytophthora cactorum]KAG3042310.1 hypothetical protein PC121_g23122 [Phytophthora cactorum]KAG4043851.1 hypothetical protein PC123_g20695 [Phytophthora cactorum]